uniref:Uncharacterized protein n=1 Tax=Compsopogon caeruleus TaxID=31354 RepID=A0A7S1TIZ5_9RHOD|eukprot:CAMPEP_0184690412 /NCGR_PEP_ID=MMETSP0312-20130426/31213_1 /TAXON_ID=31354 /ORGANISM="Compsopogon coeruleus, Strain SAG 36.94" /LENGTH=121 /DNA_ID=CAMNT_0027147903 /DNA_START=297 /DNA_END=662 /DNA_ORIENTATION=+
MALRFVVAALLMVMALAHVTMAAPTRSPSGTEDKFFGLFNWLQPQQPSCGGGYRGWGGFGFRRAEVNASETKTLGVLCWFFGCPAPQPCPVPVYVPVPVAGAPATPPAPYYPVTQPPPPTY